MPEPTFIEELAWSPLDSGLLLAALYANKADVETSKKARDKGGTEANPLLSAKPSDAEFDRAGITSALLGTGLAGILPPHIRRAALGAWAGLELTLAHQNANYRPGGKPQSDQEVATKPLLGAIAGGLLGYGLHKIIPDNGLQVGVSLSPHESKLSLSKRF